MALIPFRSNEPLRALVRIERLTPRQNRASDTGVERQHERCLHNTIKELRRDAFVEGPRPFSLLSKLNNGARYSQSSQRRGRRRSRRFHAPIPGFTGPRRNANGSAEIAPASYDERTPRAFDASELRDMNPAAFDVDLVRLRDRM